MCTNNYDDSNVKHIIDNWVNGNISKGVHSSRIINKTELDDELNYIKETKLIDGTNYRYIYYPYKNKALVDTGWVAYSYVDANFYSMASDKDGVISLINVYDYSVIKPVIILEKTSGSDSGSDSDVDSNTIVDVPDTKLSRGIMIIISGIIIICLSCMLMLINKRDKKGNRQ